MKSVAARRPHELPPSVGPEMDDLMWRVLSFVDGRGEVVSKDSTGVSSSLAMKYDDGTLKAKIQAFAHGMGNGSCSAKVTYKGKTVFDAAGCYTAAPFDVKATTYVPGAWERRLPKDPG